VNFKEIADFVKPRCENLHTSTVVAARDVDLYIYGSCMCTERCDSGC